MSACTAAVQSQLCGMAVGVRLGCCSSICHMPVSVMACACCLCATSQLCQHMLDVVASVCVAGYCWNLGVAGWLAMCTHTCGCGTGAHMFSSVWWAGMRYAHSYGSM